jgi:hypothetical protein
MILSPSASLVLLILPAASAGERYGEIGGQTASRTSTSTSSGIPGIRCVSRGGLTFPAGVTSATSTTAPPSCHTTAQTSSVAAILNASEADGSSQPVTEEVRRSHYAAGKIRPNVARVAGTARAPTIERHCKVMLASSCVASPKMAYS